MLVQTLPQTDRSCVVQISAPAKINLFLEILGKRPDGFHELATVMTTVSLFDGLRFCPNDSGEIKLKVQFPDVGRSVGAIPEYGIPIDKRNLIVASLIRLRETFGQPAMGMEIVLDKRIPAAAGLGGASSDAAAAIVAGDLAWGLKMTSEQRHLIASAIGSDVPFFLYGGTALCTGRGEQVMSVSATAGMAMVIAKPVCGLSTPTVFEQCVVPGVPADVDVFLDVVARGRPEAIAQQLHNRLQPVAESMEEEVKRLAKAFEQTECLGHQMSGSGTSYFGVFADSEAAGMAADQLGKRNPDWDVFRVKSLGRNAVTAA